MAEIDNILSLWEQCESAGGEAVLATVVKTHGSSYRLPGARLLITRSGVRAGSVSGGCLEDDLVKRAWWFTESGPMIRRYDTTPDGEVAAEYGLGCNGIIHVLLERITAGNPVMDLIRETRASRSPASIAHSLAPKQTVGSRLAIGVNGETIQNTIDEPEAAAQLQSAAEAARVRRESFLWSQEGREAFVETITPAIRLLIFGAGDDAIALARLAKHFGWEVAVYDGRAHYARSDRFPMADAVAVRHPGMIAKLPLDPWTVAVTMSHSYSQDLQVLMELSTVSILPYVGVLGPRKRTEQMFEEAGLLRFADSAVLHSPMGLDIGAEGPDQVALAVVSEIQAVMNNRTGGPLGERHGSIHAREDDDTVPNRKPSVLSGVCA
jgi:xanthine/CO dehydrogenase XdhC/CoxF family maturation factor